MKIYAKDFINKMLCINVLLFVVKEHLENIYKRQILVLLINVNV